ncbi:MAG TPA: hypothetical protein VLE53_00410 [Gemmatimonadaceae bacterium]|nr:hypothetical protein [Gemmatimonadaceae bacterium]
MKRIAVAGLALTVATAGRAQAQVIVRVQAEGQPLEGVHGELWSPTRRLASRMSDRSGKLRFGRAEAAEAVAIATRRIGFAPTRVPLDSGKAEYVVELTALPAPLAESTTLTAVQLCPNVDGAEARRLWEAATRRYLAPQADTMTRFTELTQVEGNVRAESLAVIDPSHETRGAHLAVSDWIMGGRRLIESQGYVWLMTAALGEADVGIWRYASLQSWHASHFGADLFAQRHTLSVLGGDEREITLAFCPRSRSETGLQGTLRLARDTTFIAARWAYWNPQRNGETAGGEVVFAPPGVSATGEPLPLLPLSGLFWRKLLNGRYWQRWEEYDRWLLAPGDDQAAGAASAWGETRPPLPKE